jgi:hypothetical protein
MEPDVSNCPHRQARLLQAPQLLFGNVRLFERAG